MDPDGHRQANACPIRRFATFFLPNPSSRDRLAGFTLIELMVAIAIVSTLSAIATPLYLGHLEKARVAVAISDLKTIEAAVYNYYATKAALPDSLAQINLDTFLDPWGASYAYLRINGGAKNIRGRARKDHFLVPVNDDFDIYSMGKDGQSKAPFTTPVAQDDIVRAFNGGYYGKVSDM